MKVIITSHYEDRFRERIARTKRVQYFAEKALNEGKAPEEIKDSRIRYKLKNLNHQYGEEYKYVIYNGFLHVFCDNLAITVYPYAKDRQ